MMKRITVIDVMFWTGLSLIAFWLSEAKSAEPGDHTISWTAPTKRVDGTALKPDEIVGYDIRTGVGPKVTTWQAVKRVDAKTSALPITLTEPGNHCFQGRTIAKATSVTEVKSAWSKQACIDIETVLTAPQPPIIEMQIRLRVGP